MHNFLPACNCFNIIMLLDDYRIWRPVTILHLFLWERIYSARKGFALCCASMQMCVIGLLFSVFVFSVWHCLLLMHDSDAQFYKVYWTLVKHWFTCCIGVVFVVLQKSKKRCVWIFKHHYPFCTCCIRKRIYACLLVFHKSSLVVVVFVVYSEDYKSISV